MGFRKSIYSLDHIVFPFWDLSMQLLAQKKVLDNVNASYISQTTTKIVVAIYLH